MADTMNPAQAAPGTDAGAPVAPQTAVPGATPTNQTPIVADPSMSGLTPTQGQDGAGAPQDAAVPTEQNQPQNQPEQPNQNTQAVQLPNPAAYGDAQAVVPVQHSDSRVRAVEALMAEKGITNAAVMEVFGRSMQTGQLADVDVAKLTTLMGEASANVIMASLTSYNADMERQSAEAEQTAHSMFGGKEGFEAACTWLHNNLSGPNGAELKVIQTLAAQGGANTKVALEMLLNKFNASGSASPNLMTPDGSGNANPDSKPFTSNREYSEALKQAYYNGTPQDVAQVNARFAISTSLHRS